MGQIQLGLFEPDFMEERGPSRHLRGWVYVKADTTNALVAKVGFTTKTLEERMTETGQANLVLFSAYQLGARAKEAEGRFFAGVQIPRQPHLMTGWESEWLVSDPWAVDQAVASTLVADGLVAANLEQVKFDPKYKYVRVKALLGVQFYSDFWTRYFRNEGAEWKREVAELMQRPLPPRRR